MTHSLAQIGNADVHSQGTIIVPQDTSIKLTPFNDQPGYIVEIIFLIDNSLDVPVHISSLLKDHYVMTWRMQWRENTPIVNIGLEFANADRFRYKINTIVTIIGLPERYAIDFRYTIFREAKR